LTGVASKIRVAAAGGDWDMLEYLGYALFVMLVIACLGYVMRSLESEEASPDQNNSQKQ
jgi:hypothetical protein